MCQNAKQARRITSRPCMSAPAIIIELHTFVPETSPTLLHALQRPQEPLETVRLLTRPHLARYCNGLAV